jgi:hypothetical protein
MSLVLPLISALSGNFLKLFGVRTNQCHYPIPSLRGIAQMSFAALSQIFLFLLWPGVFLAILYFSDKEKFKQRLKHFKFKDW